MLNAGCEGRNSQRFGGWRSYVAIVVFLADQVDCGKVSQYPDWKR